MTKRFRYVLPGIFGMLTALLVVVVFQLRNNSSEQPKEKESEINMAALNQTASTQRNLLPAETPSSVPGMQHETAMAPHATSIKSTLALENKTLSSAFPSETEQLRSIQALVADHEHAIALHDREPRDINWASRMEIKLQETFQSMPENSKGRLGRSDCRSQTCTVTIIWPSREIARQELLLSSNVVGTIPCGSRMELPPDDGSQSEYQATILMDCAGHQAEAVN